MFFELEVLVVVSHVDEPVILYWSVYPETPLIAVQFSVAELVVMELTDKPLGILQGIAFVENRYEVE